MRTGSCVSPQNKCLYLVPASKDGPCEGVCFEPRRCKQREGTWFSLIFLDCSESVTHVTAPNHHAATQALCGVTRVTRGNLHAANSVTCSPILSACPGLIFFFVFLFYFSCLNCCVIERYG